MNKEKMQEFIESFKKQLDINNLKANEIATEDIIKQYELSKEYENSSDKEGFLKSKKGLQFMTLTCNVGNMSLTDTLKLICEKNGILEPCPDWNGYDEYLRDSVRSPTVLSCSYHLRASRRSLLRLLLKRFLPTSCIG